MKHFVNILAVALVLVGNVYSDVVANHFVDNIVASLKAKKNIDPFVLGEHKLHFDKKVGITGLVHLTGDVTIHSVRLTGLSQVARIGDVAMENNNGSFSAALRMGNSNVQANADITIELVHGLVHKNVAVEVDVGDLKINFEVGIGTDNQPWLKEFNIDEFSHIKFHIHALSVLDPLLDVMADKMGEFFNNQIRLEVTKHVKEFLVEELKHFKMGSD